LIEDEGIEYEMQVISMNESTAHPAVEGMIPGLLIGIMSHGFDDGIFVEGRQGNACDQDQEPPGDIGYGINHGGREFF